jgi:membrane-associated phospholipid phosphatase
MLGKFKATLWIYLPFSAALIMVIGIALLNLNLPLFLFLNRLSHYTGSWIWSNITIFGDTLVFAVLFLPFIRRFPYLIYAMLLALILSTLLVQIPKHIFDIPRPAGLLSASTITIIGPDYRHNAFPSGHSATIFCLYILFLQYIRSPYGKVLLLLFSTGVMLSRVVVGIHWPLDISTGAVIGILSGYVAVDIVNNYLTKIPDKLHIIISALLILSAIVLLIPYSTYYPQAYWLQRLIAAAAITLGIPEYIRFIKKIRRSLFNL